MAKCFMRQRRGARQGEAGSREWEFELPPPVDGEEMSSAVSHMAVKDPRAPADAQRSSCESRFLVFVPVESGANGSGEALRPRL